MPKNCKIKALKVVVYIFIIAAVLTGCGAIERPNIPLSGDEKTFFEQLKSGVPQLDSIKREVIIGRMGYRIISTDIQVDVYAKNIDMTDAEMDSIATIISNFYSKPVVGSIPKFDRCEMSFSPQNIAIKTYTHRYQPK